MRGQVKETELYPGTAEAMEGVEEGVGLGGRDGDNIFNNNLISLLNFRTLPYLPNSFFI